VDQVEDHEVSSFGRRPNWRCQEMKRKAMLESSDGGGEVLGKEDSWIGER
jgi:hypothetical protein